MYCVEVRINNFEIFLKTLIVDILEEDFSYYFL